MWQHHQNRLLANLQSNHIIYSTYLDMSEHI